MNKGNEENDLQLEFTKAKREIEYYKTLAKRAGEKRLKETEELSRMIDLHAQAKTALQTARDELEERVKQRTAELAESEELYRAMFEDSSQAVALLQAGVILQANPAYLKLFGRENEGGISGESGFQFVHPDDHRKLKVGAALPHGKSESIQLRGIKACGTLIQLETTFNQITVAGKAALLATIIDVTERERLAATAKALEDQRQHYEKMEAIGLLAGGVAHDLNNVLSGIINYPELILLDLPKDSPVADDIREIGKSGEKAAAIVKDLLALARRSVVVSNPVSMNTVVTEYLRSLEFRKLQSENTNCSINATLEETLLNLDGSAVHLSKVLMNLLSNAVEAMPAEGGEVQISTAMFELSELEAASLPLDTGTYVQLTVRDNGSGIAPEDLAHIFDPFFSKKPMGRSGTGLGMAVVWGSVADHKGHIECESEVGKGTTIRILFPASGSPNANAETPTPPKHHLGHRERILVVDDDPGQRKISRAMLNRLNYEVVTVNSGEAALEAITKLPEFDLLVLDMIMNPGMNGLTTFESARQLKPEIRAIIASGYSANEHIGKALAIGASAFLQKPYSLEDLSTAVHDALV